MGINISKNLRNIFLLIFLTSCMVNCSPNISLCQMSDSVIKSIEITGNSNVKEKTIRNAIEIDKGDKYSADAISEDIKNIYRLGLFNDVQVDIEELPEGIGIRFIVVEKPFVKRIDFKGNQEFSDSKLSKQIESKKGEAFDRLKMQVDSEKLMDFYKDKGFTDIVVENYTTTDPESGNVIITYFITEGNKIKIAKINFIGLKSYPSKKIKKLMKTREKKFYKEEELQEDIGKIEEFFRNRGYLKVKLGESIIAYDKERTEMYVTIFIYEGMPYIIKEISFEGNVQFKDEQLKKVVKLKIDEIYREKDFRETVGRIQELYGEKGYIRMRIIPQYRYNEDKKEVYCNFNIVEGGVVYVDDLLLEGNIVTRDYVIEREFLLNRGDPLNVKKVRKTQERIYNLGFFSDVKVDIGQTMDPDKVDLVFDVVEQKTGLASIGAGYSSSDGLLGTIQITQSNLFGRGQRLSLLWEFGEKKQNYQISFNEPWLFGTRTPFSFTIYDLVRKKEYESETERELYKEGRRGGSIKIGRYLADILSLHFKYGYEQVEIFDIGMGSEIKDQEGKNTTSSFTTSIVRDSRDNFFDASRGSRNSFSTEVAGGMFGGDNNFVKYLVSSSWFFPTFWHFVLGINAEAGGVDRFGPSEEVPIYERFYVGGAESVRGYDYRGEIGPPEGGKVMFYANAEYKFPLVMERGRTVLQGAIFYDIGGTWRSTSDVKLNRGLEEDNLKAGFGAGIRFKTPVFPIRLDWGYGLDHRPDEDKSQWHFTIGQVF